MKIAILTWHTGENYGTNLQCFALQQYLKSNYNVQVSLLNYRAKPSDYEPKSWRYLLDNPIARIKVRLKRRKGAQIAAYYNDKYMAEYKLKQERCNEFRSMITFTKPIVSAEDWQKINQEFDVFICGSDQIWNPTVFNYYYYFAPISDDKKKISYAPSLGTGMLPTYMHDKYRKALKSFTAISTRESLSARQLTEVLGKKVEHMLDPTFLLTREEWCKYGHEDSYVKGKYLLCYFISHNEDCYRTAERYAKEHGLTIVSLVVSTAGGYGIQGAAIDVSSGPREFLSLIENASCVMTNSFHCTVFSIIYHKEFFVLSSNSRGKMADISLRYKDLLSFLNMEERYLANNFDKRLTEVKNIDWDDVQKRLDRKRQECMDFLKHSIFDEK